MFSNTRCLFALTAVLALAVSACSSTPARPVQTQGAAVACVGGVIRSAEEAARYTGCTTVTGDLQIAGSKLRDLTALATLRSVSGALQIANNPELDELRGLERLGEVGSLEVRDNPELNDLAGLENLRTCGSVIVSRNKELSSLHGLEGLERTEKLVIQGNSLFDTSGLSKLREVGELTIADNPKLISLRGLNGLTHARSIQIRNNRVLCAKLGLLPRLDRVADALVVSSNHALSKGDIERLREQVKLQLEESSPAARQEAALH